MLLLIIYHAAVAFILLYLSPDLEVACQEFIMSRTKKPRLFIPVYSVLKLNLTKIFSFLFYKII